MVQVWAVLGVAIRIIAGKIFQKASSPNYAKMAKIINLKSANPAKDAEDLIGAIFLRALANCKNNFF